MGSGRVSDSLDANYRVTKWLGLNAEYRYTDPFLDLLMPEMRPGTSLPATGAQVYQGNRCNACHAVKGAGVAREAEWVNDRWVDLVCWGILEEEWRRNRRRMKRASK